MTLMMRKLCKSSKALCLALLVVLNLKSCFGFTLLSPTSSISMMSTNSQASFEGTAQTRRSFMERILKKTTPIFGAVVFSATPRAEAKGSKKIKNAPIEELENGIKYQEMAIGDGPSPKTGDRCAIHYSLYYNGFEVESSRDSSGLAARPVGFNFGDNFPQGSSLPVSLQSAIKGMNVGGRRKVILPPELAYGKKGYPPMIPADAEILIDVSLWSVKPAGVNPNLTLPGQQNYF